MKGAELSMMSLALCACGSARIAGGAVVASTAEPSGAVAATWTTADCRDARGEPITRDTSVIRLVRRPDGRTVLVETQPAYDSLVVTNSFVRGQEWIFQVAVKSSASAPYLREYRVPASVPGPGRFSIVARQWDSRETDDGFVAWYASPAVTCALWPSTRSAGGSAVD